MDALNILVDGGLLSASLTACFYCIVLSRRVRRLASADQGVGKGVADMVKAVERLNSSLSQTRAAARTESEALEQHLQEARAIAERTAALLEDGTDQLAVLDRKLTDARQIIGHLRSAVNAARDSRRQAGQTADADTAADGFEASPDQASCPRYYEDETEILLLEAVMQGQAEAGVGMGGAGEDPLPDVMPMRSRHLNGSAAAVSERAVSD